MQTIVKSTYKHNKAYSQESVCSADLMGGGGCSRVWVLLVSRKNRDVRVGGPLRLVRDAEGG